MKERFMMIDDKYYDFLIDRYGAKPVDAHTLQGDLVMYYKATYAEVHYEVLSGNYTYCVWVKNKPVSSYMRDDGLSQQDICRALDLYFPRRKVKQMALEI